MKNALHFVGFRGDEYTSAVAVFGKPDFFHKCFDNWALAEFFEGDTVVFANGYENKFTEYTFDDSNTF
jgi:hypothetical protein